MVLNENPSELLTLTQTASLLQVHKDTLRRWDKEGKLKAVRIGQNGPRRYSKTEVMALRGGNGSHQGLASLNSRQLLTRLSEVLRNISSNLEAPKMAQTVVNEAVGLMGSTRSAIYLLNPDHTILEPFVAVDIEDSRTVTELFYPNKIPVSAQPIFEEILSSGEVTFVSDTYNDHRTTREFFEMFDTRSLIIAPLKSRDGRLKGVLGFFWVGVAHIFSEEELIFVSSLAAQTSIGLENAELYQEAQLEISQRKVFEAQLREQTETIETVNRLGQIISAELDLQKLVQAVTDAATGISGAEFGAFFYFIKDEKGENFTLYSLSGKYQESFQNMAMPRNTKIFGPTFRGEDVIRLDDVKLDPRYAKNSPYYGLPPGHMCVSSYMAVPVISRVGEVLGGLFFGHHKPGIFTQREEDLIVGLSAQIAAAVDNARLYREARQAIEARDEFLSIAAHELKTPITNLLGFTQLLLRQTSKGITPEPVRLNKALSTIEQQSKKLAKLISQLLDISRLESSKLVLFRSTADLKGLVEEVAANMGLNTQTHSIKVDGPSPFNVEIDALRMEQVIVNLLDNAIKYSPDGGTIEIKLEPLPASGEARLLVTDHGIGIPVENRAHLFDRFYQAHPHSYLGGMGLGLFISRQIVDLHAGKLEAEFPPEGGTRFIVTIPVKAPAPDTASEEG